MSDFYNVYLAKNYLDVENIKTEIILSGIKSHLKIKDKTIYPIYRDRKDKMSFQISKPLNKYDYYLLMIKSNFDRICILCKESIFSCKSINIMELYKYSLNIEITLNSSSIEAILIKNELVDIETL